MARILIKCPSTGKDVYTGLSTDKASFDGATLTQNQTGCPHCGKAHT
jgi:hypothetical protein